MLPAEFSEGKPVDINEESDDVPVTLVMNFTFRELSEMFRESMKNKSLEASPSLKRSITIHCLIEKNVHPEL